MREDSLQERVAVVTGGAGGIGRAIVDALVAAGATVVITDVADMEGAAVVDELGTDQVSYVHLDIRDDGAVRSVFEAIALERGRIDVLVTSAGVALHGPSLDVTDEAWERVIDVNLTGTFRCAREAARHMVRGGRGGSIVAIGSISGEIANTPQAQTAYNASKGGVHVMVRCLAVEWASFGIRVNAIAPGFVDTPLTRAGVPEAWRTRWAERTPAGRLAEPHEIAAVVAFVASDAASYVTGAVLPVDGGYLAW